MTMETRQLRSPEDRVGTLPNTALPPPESEPATLEDLLRRGLTGDERALHKVVHRLQPAMIDLAAHHVRSRAEAEDVVQETWMAALGAVARFEGRASIKTWLLRILTYRAITAARKTSRATPMSQLRPRASGAPDGLAMKPMWMSDPMRPDEELAVRELRTGVERLLATLPPQQRQVVKLRDLDGLSMREVRDRTGLTSGNQRVLLHRGRMRLRAPRSLAAPKAG
jgi:RNA polymerase sigma-70 factor, ECF subfamily